jgi:hypothetical protein
VNKILFAERDEKGNVVVRPKTTPGSDEEIFMRTGVRRLVPRWRAKELWNESCRQAAAADRRR